jgi:hypothetical protein
MLLFLAAFAAAIAGLSCTPTSAVTGSLDDLEIELVQGTITANLMPIVPPDPVSCSLALRVRNANPTTPISGVFFPSGELQLSSTGQRIGTFTFSSEWKGRLAPLEADTVLVRKASSLLPVTLHPCGEHVDLLLAVRNAFPIARTVRLDTLRFECVY